MLSSCGAKPISIPEKPEKQAESEPKIEEPSIEKPHIHAKAEQFLLKMPTRSECGEIKLVCPSCGEEVGTREFSFSDTVIVAGEDTPSGFEYSKKGVDASHYQGKVDWKSLEGQIDFAYIKATEGKTSIDSKFAQNLKALKESPISFGAYHFFSFEASGEKQAENFIRNVPKLENMLPPAVDVELYGKYKNGENADFDKIRSELRIFADKLSEYYETAPVIYVSEKSYETIVRGYFDDCKIWTRSTGGETPVENWEFLQYSSSHLLICGNSKIPIDADLRK